MSTSRPMISVVNALAIVGAKSIEAAPFKKGVSWEAGRTLSVVRPVMADRWPHKPQPRRLAELRFGAEGVAVHFAVPQEWEPQLAAAIEAIRAEVALLPPPEVGWTLSSGSSSDTGQWYCLSAPDGRSWSISERFLIPEVNPWNDVIRGEVVAPEGTLEVAQPARMRGDFSRGPFSREAPTYRVMPIPGRTDFIRFVEAFRATRPDSFSPYMTHVPYAQRAWRGEPCGDAHSIRMRAILQGAPAPSPEAVIREINAFQAARGWALAQEWIELGWELPNRRPWSPHQGEWRRTPDGLLPELSAYGRGYVNKTSQNYLNLEEILRDAILSSVRREPTPEEWAAAGFPVV